MKINKVESFSLERIVQDSSVISGNAFYHTGGGHNPHIDLHVNKENNKSFDYRLYNPSGGNTFEMNSGENFIFKK